MNAKDAAILDKILKYLAKISSYVDGFTVQEFLEDSKTIDATAFSLGQIGEMAKLLSDDIQCENPSIPWRQMKGLRNRIVHDYENIDMLTLWSTIKEDLPALELKIRALRHV